MGWEIGGKERVAPCHRTAVYQSLQTLESHSTKCNYAEYKRSHLWNFGIRFHIIIEDQNQSRSQILIKYCFINDINQFIPN